MMPRPDPVKKTRVDAGRGGLLEGGEREQEEKTREEGPSQKEERMRPDSQGNSWERCSDPKGQPVCGGGGEASREPSRRRQQAWRTTLDQSALTRPVSVVVMMARKKARERRKEKKRAEPSRAEPKAG